MEKKDAKLRANKNEPQTTEEKAPENMAKEANTDIFTINTGFWMLEEP